MKQKTRLYKENLVILLCVRPCVLVCVGRHHCWAVGPLGLGLSLYIVPHHSMQYNHHFIFFHGIRGLGLGFFSSSPPQQPPANNTSAAASPPPSHLRLPRRRPGRLIHPSRGGPSLQRPPGFHCPSGLPAVDPFCELLQPPVAGDGLRRRHAGKRGAISGVVQLPFTSAASMVLGAHAPQGRRPCFRSPPLGSRAASFPDRPGCRVATQDDALPPRKPRR
jgi:hypothetical protein